MGTNYRQVAAIDILIIGSLVLALLSWCFDPFRLETAFFRLKVGWGFKPVALCLLLLAVRMVIVAKTRTHATILARIALALGVVLLFFVAIEGVLKLMNVPRGEPVFVMRGQDGEALRADGSMVHDQHLLWRFQPGKTFKGQPINSLGFLDREVSASKPAGVRRVICLGDSCTAQGAPPYSGYLNDRLNQHPPDTNTWEAFNTAVHGYTAVQGLRLFRERVAEMSPNIVTVFFGWNDHWLDHAPDSVRLSQVDSPFLNDLRHAIAKKRLFTALTKFSRSPATQERTLRVPPDDYNKTLRELISEIRACGAEPIMLTAPRAVTLSRLLVHNRSTTSVEEAIRLHDMYVEITRSVARDEGARLIDLAAAFNRAEDFSNDGIHFTDAGLQRVAEHIHQELLRQP